MGFRIAAIDHVQLAMPPGHEAEGDAVAFYQDLLGLDRMEKPAVLAARGGVWFSNGSVQIHLGVDREFRAAHRAHPALVVEDLDDLHRTLVEAGHAVRWDEELPAVRRCYAEDPFGNRIELIAG